LYPLEGDKEPIMPLSEKEKDKVITVMKYGSDADKIFYYFCPKFYCLRDEMMILEKDFKSNHDREGKSKPENSCPFCHGRSYSS